jgi:hypothetical protein
VCAQQRHKDIMGNINAVANEYNQVDGAAAAGPQLRVR